MQELKDDLESEKAARDRAENQKRDLKEELEALRLELIDSGTNSEAQAEALRKHEAELSNARKQLEADAACVFLKLINVPFSIAIPYLVLTKRLLASCVRNTTRMLRS